MSDKLIITAALAGGATTKENNPNTPYTPEEFAEESYRCYQEGVSIVHIHAKNPDTGMATADLKIVRPVIEAIRDRCPEMVINISTGSGTDPDERIAPVLDLKPDMASLNVNSMNFAFGNYKTGELAFEFIYQNPVKKIEEYGKAMKEIGVKPEIEVFEPGGLNNTLFIRKQGDVFVEPMHFQLVYGVLGGMVFDPLLQLSLVGLLPEKATYSVCGVGPHQIPAAFQSIISGGHIRIGLEDNTRVPGGELAKGSWEQAVWVKEIARIIGRELATCDDTRELLELRKK
ncbi:MAG: 3-keto-5-aminohexanoate cleavage protein [Deltaproteobacteria bacterium]|nr:3-keto-5-aminohexanoate cleavage protein [Deltaproteobacteria bacterium]MBW2086472.1 3-keto-5-aminohexanoate cleavage protein [Deltaproteobacteria bacterium]